MLQWQLKTINLDAFEQYLNSYPSIVSKAAYLAINTAARKAHSLAKKEMLKQVKFPSSYLGTPETGHLKVKQWAAEDNLVATISAQFRPTSLLRYVTNQSTLRKKASPTGPTVGRGTARLQIKPGSISSIDNAYILRLKNGNEGLGIRLKMGEEPTGTTAAKRYGKTNWWLLYGPSVNQVFNDVRDEISPTVVQILNMEFSRQIARLSNG